MAMRWRFAAQSVKSQDPTCLGFVQKPAIADNRSAPGATELLRESVFMEKGALGVAALRLVTNQDLTYFWFIRLRRGRLGHVLQRVVFQIPRTAGIDEGVE